MIIDIRMYPILGKCYHRNRQIRQNSIRLLILSQFRPKNYLLRILPRTQYPIKISYRTNDISFLPFSCLRPRWNALVALYIYITGLPSLVTSILVTERLKSSTTFLIVLLFQCSWYSRKGFGVIMKGKPSRKYCIHQVRYCSVSHDRRIHNYVKHWLRPRIEISRISFDSFQTNLYLVPQAYTASNMKRQMHANDNTWIVVRQRLTGGPHAKMKCKCNIHNDSPIHNCDYQFIIIVFFTYIFVNLLNVTGNLHWHSHLHCVSSNKQTNQLYFSYVKHEMLKWSQINTFWRYRESEKKRMFYVLMMLVVRITHDNWIWLVNGILSISF